MGAAYRVTAPLVIVRDETGASHHVYQGGLLPDSADKDHVQQLVDGELVEKVKAAPAPEPAPAEKSDKVDDILAEVGDDKDKAAAALELENAKGDKARSSLVSKLEAIANPDS